MKRILVILALGAAVFATPSFAGNPSNYTYLALGDSVSFGFNPLLYTPSVLPNQFVGYPELMAQQIHLAQSKKEVNASCPGETSASFLLGTAGPPDFGCNFPHVNPAAPPFKLFPGLHVAYTSPQMEYAMSQLTTNKHIDMVTLSLGANDLLVLETTCHYVPGVNDPAAAACVQQALLPDPSHPTQLGPVMQAYAANLTAILTAIRQDAGYQGKLILLTYYSPSTDPLVVSAISLLNAVMRQVGRNFDATFADGFGAFLTAAAILNQNAGNFDPCSAGLLVRLPGDPVTCDVHPSALGQTVLASATIAASKSQ